MLYQSLKLTNGIWVLAELRIQPGNPNFTVRAPAPSWGLCLPVPGSLSHPTPFLGRGLALTGDTLAQLSWIPFETGMKKHQNCDFRKFPTQSHQIIQIRHQIGMSHCGSVG